MFIHSELVGFIKKYSDSLTVIYKKKQILDRWRLRNSDLDMFVL